MDVTTHRDEDIDADVWIVTMPGVDDHRFTRNSNLHWILERLMDGEWTLLTEGTLAFNIARAWKLPNV